MYRVKFRKVSVADKVKTSLQPDIPRKSRSRGLTPKEEAEWWIRAGLDKDGFRVKFISMQIGSGVFAMQEFKKGDFLMEYAGEHISPSEAEERRRTVYKRSKHHYIFHFRHEEKEKCIDATKQYQRLGRMVNDNEDTPNSRMKRIFLRGGRTPYLALFALSDIKIGDEITYDYGDPTAPWRNKDKTEESEMDNSYDSDPFGLLEKDTWYSSDDDPDPFGLLDEERSQDEKASTNGSVCGSQFNMKQKDPGDYPQDLELEGMSFCGLTKMISSEPPSAQSLSDLPSAQSPDHSLTQAPSDLPSAQSPPDIPSTQSPPDHSSTHSPSDLPPAQSPPDLPSKQSPPDLPSTQSPPDLPSTQSPPDHSSAQSRPDIPSAQSRPDIPSAQSWPDLPSAQSQPDLPSPQSRPDHPSPQSLPDLPSPQSGPDLPSAQSRPNHLSPLSGPDHSSAQSPLDLPSGQSQPDLPSAQSLPDHLSPQSWPDHSPAQSRLDLPSAQSQPDLSSAHSQSDLPSAQSHPDLPSAQPQPDIPSTHSWPDLLSVHSQPDLSSAHSQSDLPSAQSHPDLPSAQPQPDIPSTHSWPDLLSVHSQPDLPSAQSWLDLPSGQSQTDISSGESQPDLPSAQSQPNLPSSPSRPDHPSPQSWPDHSSAESLLDLPSGQPQADLPSAQSRCPLPSAQSQPDLPSALSRSDHPSPQSWPNHSSAQSWLDLPSALSRPDHPSPQSWPDHSSAQSSLDLRSGQPQADLPSAQSQLDLPSAPSRPDHPSPQSWADHSSAQSSLDLRAGQPQADLPSAQSQLDLPSAQSRCPLPSAQSRPNHSSAQSRPDLPSGQPQPDLPSAQSQLDFPSAQSQPDLSSTQSQPDHPSPQSRPDLPSAQSRPDLPSAQSQPDLSSAQSRPDHPSPQSRPDLPSVQSQPDFPSPPDFPLPQSYFGHIFEDPPPDLPSACMLSAPAPLLNLYQDLDFCENSDESEVSEVFPVLNNVQARRKTIDSEKKPYVRPARPCLYCGVMQKSLARHLARKHKDKELVAKALASSGKTQQKQNAKENRKKGKTEKEKALDEIRKMGIKKHNADIIRQCTDDNVLPTNLLRERNQGSNELVMCPACFGFYSKMKLRQHQPYCLGKDQSSNRLTPVFPSSFCSSVSETKSKTDSAFREKILDCFHKDDIGHICCNDRLILLMGKHAYSKGKGRKKTMTEMRQMGLLLKTFRDTSEHSEFIGEDLLQRRNFPALEEAIEAMTVNEDRSLKASLRLSLGHLLKHCIKIMKGQYTVDDCLEKATEIDLFASVLDMKWDMLFTKSRLQVESRRQDSLRRPKQLPLEEDVVKLRNHNIQAMEDMLNNPYVMWNTHEYNTLRALVVCRLTLFNARRGGEPCKLTLRQWMDAEDNVWINPQFVDKIDDPLEKSLLQSYKVAYQGGKNNRLVPVLIPKDTIPAIRKLVSLRDEIKIEKSNQYVFANTQGSQTHVDGWPCVNKVCNHVNLNNPKLICADTFRHRASTIYELQDASAEDRRAFYAHMGHSEQINQSIYQCPTGLREILKVAPYLRKIDGGNDTVASRQPHKKRSVSAVTSDPDDLDDCVPDDTVPESPVKKKRKAVLSDLSDDCSQDDTCDTVTPSPVTKKRRIKRKKMADSDISDEEDVKATRSKPARRYFSWNEKDAGVVVRYFAKYIRDGGEGTKGCLPGKKEIEAFLECNPEVIKSVRGGKECVGIIKAKVFNERSKRRAAVKKMKKTLNM